MYRKPKCSSFEELKILKDKLSEKAGAEFDNLVSSLNINVKNNEEWSNSYYSLVKETTKLSKSIKRLRVWKWILLIPLIFPFFLMNSAQKKKEPILAQKTREMEEARSNLQKQLSEFKTQLSYDFAYNKIINKVWDDVKLDLYMDDEVAHDWEHDYLQYMPLSSCATSLVSGQMFEHPFVLMNRKDQRWQPHVYVGSVPVTYTIYRDGKAEMATTIVTATVTLPEPVWFFSPYFLYRTSKPMDLTFCNDISKHQLKKKINKLEQQSMENPEFDKVFPASRNDEKDYRIVFTPIAQEGFVQLFKDRKYRIEKEKEITSISTPMKLIDNDYTDDVNYNLGVWKEKYVDWILRLVDNIGTFSLPIANMPVYYQLPYVNHSGQYLSHVRYQDITNWLVNTYNLWSAFETDAVFECKTYRKIQIGSKSFTCVQMSCNYFHPNHRVEMVPTPGPKGIVMVPVHVIDYFERKKDLFVYTSENIKSKDREIVGDNWAIHSGQLIMWSWSTIDLDKLSETIKNM